MEDERLFGGRDLEFDGLTELMQLANVTSLLGPPPKSLLARGKNSYLFFDRVGERICKGYHMTRTHPVVGQFKHKKILPTKRTLASTITALKRHDKDAFIDFVNCMLVWEPEKRKTAKDLLGHPWLAQ